MIEQVADPLLIAIVITILGLSIKNTKCIARIEANQKNKKSK